jgi:mRNA degradation ribonuclease J1/J2
MPSLLAALICIVFLPASYASGATESTERSKLISQNEDTYMTPNDLAYIYSSYEAFNEKMDIDFKRLWHWMKRVSINSRGFSLDENRFPCFEKRYNASGNASGEDITWIIDPIDPDYMIPIHTEARDLFAKSFGNVVDEGGSGIFDEPL